LDADTEQRETAMDLHSRHALVADIGGTFISLALADIDELTIDHFALLSAADFAAPMDAVERYLKSLPKRPSKASFAVAGKVEGDHARMTFRPWTIRAGDIKAVTGAEVVTLVNDVEALALALPHLTGDELIPIQAGRADATAPRVVISAGTGLGVAAATYVDGRWVPLMGEGGQMTFPAPHPGEFDFRRSFPKGAHLPAEAVFSGRGLTSLYGALSRHHKKDQRALTPVQITAAAASGDDPVATEAMRLMGLWFARFAGDVALLYGATGGVYLAGGFSASIVPAMGAAAFTAAFADKGASRARLEAIPVKVIKTGADAGLRGAAVALAEHIDREHVSARIRRAG
jgi:glucokinase